RRVRRITVRWASDISRPRSKNSDSSSASPRSGFAEVFIVNPNPFLGVVFHWLGGLASASFYIPYRGVRKWSWETYWLVGGFFSWIIAPTSLATCLVPGLWDLIASAPGKSLGWAVFFGAMWGVGGLTFGLTMRYL